MVADLEVELGPVADLAQRDGVVLPAVGRLRVREVRQRRGERVAPLLDLGQLRLHPLELGRRPSCIRSISSLASLPSRFAAAISSDAWFCSARRPSTSGQQLAATRVERQQLVEGLAGAPALERRPGRARVVADRSQVEHEPPGLLALGAGLLLFGLDLAGVAGLRRPVDLAARVAGRRTPPTASASSPTTMFWGMIAPEKPPLRIA